MPTSKLAVLVVGVSSFAALAQTPDALGPLTPMDATSNSETEVSASARWSDGPAQTALRLGAETLLGVGAGGAAMFASTLLMTSMCFSGLPCSEGAFLGVILGSGLVGLSAGVSWTGRALGGRGSFLAALLGGAAGMLLGATLVPVDVQIGLGMMVALPVVGAILGYEFQHRSGRHRATVGPFFTAGGGGLRAAVVF